MTAPSAPKDKAPRPLREGGLKSGDAPGTTPSRDPAPTPARDGGMMSEGGPPAPPKREGGMLGEG